MTKKKNAFCLIASGQTTSERNQMGKRSEFMGQSGLKALPVAFLDFASRGVCIH